MAALTVSSPQTGSRKRQPAVCENAALAFIETIESSWKGYEPFAFWLVQRLKPKTIVDLGFDRGLSTIAFAYRNKGHVFGIDWFDESNYAVKCFALDAAFRNVSNALRFQYVKNIHLIIGPFRDVSKHWKREIDVLHIDCAYTYASAKQHYENWSRYLSSEGVVLIHDVAAYPQETGRFFDELALHKVVFPRLQGLGVASSNEALIGEVKKQFFEAS